MEGQWAMVLPAGWLVSPVPGLNPGDRLDVLGYQTGQPVEEAGLIVKSGNDGRPASQSPSASRRASFAPSVFLIVILRQTGGRPSMRCEGNTPQCLLTSRYFTGGVTGPRPDPVNTLSLRSPTLPGALAGALLSGLTVPTADYAEARGASPVRANSVAHIRVKTPAPAVRNPDAGASKGIIIIDNKPGGGSDKGIIIIDNKPQ